MASDVAALASAKTNAPEAAVVGGVVPYLTVSDASGAADFYKGAFAAREVARMPAQDGRRLMHCHLMINGASVMLSDAFPESGHELKPPQAFMLHIQVPDPQVWWDRAVAAGCDVAMPMQVMFWGDRYGHLKDPYGITWTIGGPA
jgi:uncharacterized glyoxalase superfamily protein PhnB